MPDGNNVTRKRIPPVGPSAPPRPSEVDREERQPMAVASDAATMHDSFKPTTARPDQMSAETARRYRDPNLDRDKAS